MQKINCYFVQPQFLIVFFSIFLVIAFSSFSSRERKDNTKEKIYIQFDKPNYYAGEDMWFKVYLVDASYHSIEALSKVVYIELINTKREIIESKVINIEEGGGPGDFKLGLDLQGGEYTVRAYTNFMRNFDHAYFFEKSFHIKGIESKNTNDQDLDSTERLMPDLQFFPEGGQLVGGYLNRVGFKCLGVDGKGIDIEGVITNEHGDEVSKIKSSKFGMGMVEFIPEAGSQYKVVIPFGNTESSYAFPVALNQGVKMKVTERKDAFDVVLQSSLGRGFNDFYLIGTQRKGVFFKAQLSGSRKEALIKVPKEMLIQGIVQFTFFDHESNPLGERLSFYEPDEAQVEVKITASKLEYGARELVELELSVGADAKEKLKTNLSMAVTDLSMVQPSLNELDIKSYLLLNSELKGNIEQPGYYFNLAEPERKNDLDILMMTQGWRQFIVNDTLNENSRYAVQTGIQLNGYIDGLSKENKSGMAEVSITYKNKYGFAHETVMTNDKGEFVFRDLPFKEMTKIAIQPVKVMLGKRAKDPKKFFVKMDSVEAPVVSSKGEVNLLATSKDGIEAHSRSIEYLESLYNANQRPITLEGVVIESFSTERADAQNKKRLIYSEVSSSVDSKNTVFLPTFTGNVLSVLRGRVPGLIVGGDGLYLRGHTTFDGDNRAIILLNGTPVNASDLETLVAAEDIDFIDVLTGAKAAIYGSRASTGVIAIYTLNSTDKLDDFKVVEKRGMMSFSHPGYSQARKFYEPIYEVEKKKEDNLDYRSTLFWSPQIDLDEFGKANISFYTAEEKSFYRVVLEGVSFDGKIIKQEAILNMPKNKI